MSQTHNYPLYEFLANGVTEKNRGDAPMLYAVLVMFSWILFQFVVQTRNYVNHYRQSVGGHNQRGQGKGDWEQFKSAITTIKQTLESTLKKHLFAEEERECESRKKELESAKAKIKSLEETVEMLKAGCIGL